MLLLAGEAMRRFAHYHTLRCDLRAIYRLVNRTWRDRKGRLSHLEHWVMSGNEFKLLLQIDKADRALAGGGEFRLMVKVAVALGRRSRGWRRRPGGRATTTPGMAR